MSSNQKIRVAVDGGLLGSPQNPDPAPGWTPEMAQVAKAEQERKAVEINESERFDQVEYLAYQRKILEAVRGERDLTAEEEAKVGFGAEFRTVGEFYVPHFTPTPLQLVLLIPSPPARLPTPRCNLLSKNRNP
jgi:hypothetical protein